MSASLEIEETRLVEFDQISASFAGITGSILEHATLYREGEVVYETSHREVYERALEELEDD